MPFSPYRTIAAEGARVGFTTCTDCGTSILLDPADKVDYTAVHEAWHEELKQWISSTRIATS